MQGSQHLGVDLRHLGEADLVNLRGREGEGGEFQDLGLVVGLAVGEIFGGERGLRVGDIVVAEEGEQLTIDGDDAGLDGDGGIGTEPGLIGHRDGRGHLLEGR